METQILRIDQKDAYNCNEWWCRSKDLKFVVSTEETRTNELLHDKCHVDIPNVRPAQSMQRVYVLGHFLESDGAVATSCVVTSAQGSPGRGPAEQRAEVVLNELRASIFAAGAELGAEHQWLFEEGAVVPEETGCFITVLENHIAPLLDPSFKQRRIAVLEAELAALKLIDDSANQFVAELRGSPCNTAVGRLYHRAADEIEWLSAELRDSDTQHERLAKILTATANALKGEPQPLHLHSWHDLAEVATKLVADRDALLSEANGVDRRVMPHFKE